MSTVPLFQPLDAGPLSLRSRIAMAPMTRSRAPGNVPNALMREYYRSAPAPACRSPRASRRRPKASATRASRACSTSRRRAPGARSPQAVHARGGKLVVQLMHTGRIGHDSNLPAGAGPLLAPSAIAAAGQMWTDQAGMQAHPRAEGDGRRRPRPRAGRLRARRRIRHRCRRRRHRAARRQRLPAGAVPESEEQPARATPTAARRRTAAASCSRWWTRWPRRSAREGRVAIRLSPFNPSTTWRPTTRTRKRSCSSWCANCRRARLGYLHLIATPGAVPEATVGRGARRLCRARWCWPAISTASAPRPRWRRGRADVVAFGRPFIANPDLPRRLRERLPLAGFDAGTLYTPGARATPTTPALRRAVRWRPAGVQF